MVKAAKGREGRGRGAGHEIENTELYARNVVLSAVTALTAREVERESL